MVLVILLKLISWPVLVVSTLFYSTNIGFLDHSVYDALCHPYLSSLHDINDEPICSTPFSFDFEQPSITEENVKDLIWKESLLFNPDPVI